VGRVVPAFAQFDREGLAPGRFADTDENSLLRGVQLSSSPAPASVQCLRKVDALIFVDRSKGEHRVLLVPAHCVPRHGFSVHGAAGHSRSVLGTVSELARPARPIGAGRGPAGGEQPAGVAVLFG
jgi:hypothetical protein